MSKDPAHETQFFPYFQRKRNMKDNNGIISCCLKTYLLVFRTCKNFLVHVLFPNNIFCGFLYCSTSMWKTHNTGFYINMGEIIPSYSSIYIYVFFLLIFIDINKLMSSYFIDLVLTFGFNSKVTFTLQETVTVACEILCCIVGRVSISVMPSTCPSHSFDSSSWILTGFPTARWTNLAISWAFSFALWTAKRLACCLKKKMMIINIEEDISSGSISSSSSNQLWFRSKIKPIWCILRVSKLSAEESFHSSIS